MAFTKAKFGIFWSLPPATGDWANLTASGVKLVMLPLEFTGAETLLRLAGMGCRVLVRVQEGSYYDDNAPARIRNQILAVRQLCPLEAVIVGNEPDHTLNWEYSSAGWGQEFAYVHRRRFDAVRRALQGAGVNVIAPATIMRSISEDEAPAPGRVTWREIMCLPEQFNQEVGYLAADGCGVHLYSYHWDGPVDLLRWLFALKQQAELWHKPLYIDEVGVADSDSPLDKMRSYINMAEKLLSVRGGRQHPLGQRVECLIPFVANGDPGDPPAWDPRFLLRDPVAYQELGIWMRS